MYDDSKTKSTSEDLGTQGIPVGFSIPLTPSQRIDNAVKIYRKKTKEAMDAMEAYRCPAFIADEYSIIVRETKELLRNDIAGINGPFDNLRKYLDTQKMHLKSISLKQSSGDMYHEIISTQICKVVLVHIEEGLNVSFASSSPSELISPSLLEIARRQPVMKKVWNAMECLDTYHFTYAFKYDVYDKKREKIKSDCRRYNVEVRSKQEIKKDEINNITDDVVGCLIKIAFVVGVGFLISLIFGS